MWGALSSIPTRAIAAAVFEELLLLPLPIVLLYPLLRRMDICLQLGILSLKLTKSCLFQIPILLTSFAKVDSMISRGKIQAHEVLSHTFIQIQNMKNYSTNVLILKS